MQLLTEAARTMLTKRARSDNARFKLTHYQPLAVATYLYDLGRRCGPEWAMRATAFAKYRMAATSLDND